MKKWKTVLIFSVTVFTGLFLLNNFLEGIPGSYCSCLDSQVLDIQCELACAFTDGCLGVSHGAGYCINDECWTPVIFYCYLESDPGLFLRSYGSTCYVNCYACEHL